MISQTQPRDLSLRVCLTGLWGAQIRDTWNSSDSLPHFVLTFAIAQVILIIL